MHGAILLVEDDEDMRESLRLILERRGFEVQTAAHGQEALACIDRARPPCLILLDLMMPVMDGWAVCAHLRADPDLARVPVVLLSGVADLGHESADLHATDYLTKPLDLARLHRIVSAYCESGGGD